jgi:hypothetical protein
LVFYLTTIMILRVVKIFLNLTNIDEFPEVKDLMAYSVRGMKSVKSEKCII